ncbi:alcohol dehydrogenase, zinc-containing [Xanthomonas citri pv. punicae str. LMG 859]|nr:alcohol dehydrogenase, zinc-containing [Xanthomonas citri pv. punicae str. LMG 859]
MHFERFEQVPEILQLPDPTPSDDGVVIKVAATGICRSDWHGWMGHDPGHRIAARAGT